MKILYPKLTKGSSMISETKWQMYVITSKLAELVDAKLKGFYSNIIGSYHLDDWIRFIAMATWEVKTML